MAKLCRTKWKRWRRKFVFFLPILALASAPVLSLVASCDDDLPQKKWVVGGNWSSNNLGFFNTEQALSSIKDSASEDRELISSSRGLGGDTASLIGAALNHQLNSFTYDVSNAGTALKELLESETTYDYAVVTSKYFNEGLPRYKTGIEKFGIAPPNPGWEKLADAPFANALKENGIVALTVANYSNIAIFGSRGLDSSLFNIVYRPSRQVFWEKESDELLTASVLKGVTADEIAQLYDVDGQNDPTWAELFPDFSNVENYLAKSPLTVGRRSGLDSDHLMAFLLDVGLQTSRARDGKSLPLDIEQDLILAQRRLGDNTRQVVEYIASAPGAFGYVPLQYALAGHYNFSQDLRLLDDWELAQSIMPIERPQTGWDDLQWWEHHSPSFMAPVTLLFRKNNPRALALANYLLSDGAQSGLKTLGYLGDNFSVSSFELEKERAKVIAWRAELAASTQQN